MTKEGILSVSSSGDSRVAGVWPLYAMLLSLSC